MNRFVTALCIVCTGALLSTLFTNDIHGDDREAAVTFGSLLDEMTDLAGLAKRPGPPYHTVQFSSYDRRSVSPDEENWYANSDGFGREPIPAFAKVLREPEANGPGLYLVAQVDSPGAVVRTWAARNAMAGILRVYLDGATAPFFEGPAYDFLGRKSSSLMRQAGVDLDCGDAFAQQDTDYLPLPFAKSLRVTWEGRLDELHFYHLQVRIYGKDTPVRTFGAKRDFAEFRDQLERTVRRLIQPTSIPGGERFEVRATLEPDQTWDWVTTKPGPGAVSKLTFRVLSKDVDAALRGTLLRVTFDGASQPQVDCPVGDFSVRGPESTLSTVYPSPWRRTAR